VLSEFALTRMRRARIVFGSVGHVAVRLFRSHRNVIAVLVFVSISACLGMAEWGLSQTLFPLRQNDPHRAQAAAGYVGSKACANCHREIYETYSQTDMGRSMSEANASFLARIPTSASIFDRHLNRHFDAYASNGTLYQSEYEVGADGKEIFRDTHKIEWIIGSGSNGFGAIARRGDYLFEAPLSFYSNINNWALSPGYEFGDYGFSRPILPACIACHAGQPQPVLDGNGRFRQPPFVELAVGCENCHGPGSKHLTVIRTNFSPQNAKESIVNPAKLAPWLADNICMRCHQTGQARILQHGKDYGDFRPGAPLDQTLGIFLVPFGHESPPQDDLLQHYLFMRLSKCYRNSRGRFGCLSCHDPHKQPNDEKAPAYFREKCTSCHADSSCTLPLALRQQNKPPDNCIGCHMPRRDVKVISHSVLTNHRIVREAKEPFPDAAFHMTTPELPDLVHLNALPGKQNPPSPLTLLEAYRQVMVAHPDYRERYWALAKQLEASEPENVVVLEALADLSLQKKSWEGVAAGIRYLDLARNRGSTNPADFELLARLLAAAGEQRKAVDVLQQGVVLIPYDAELYRLLAKTYGSLNKSREACEVLADANRIFPQDSGIRGVLEGCQSTKPAPSGP
jgi:predicted CXXCH cytochrome family protein